MFVQVDYLDVLCELRLDGAVGLIEEVEVLPSQSGLSRTNSASVDLGSLAWSMDPSKPGKTFGIGTYQLALQASPLSRLIDNPNAPLKSSILASIPQSDQGHPPW